ncbi:MAG: hypothetical protein F4X48_04935 [Acidimicrobiia bacterium]|nr:hypothetical protein [Acidimicrobiia bacterium]MYC57914.1 hypothetical protein [Acidimicrobiia bacterium]
MAEATEVAKLRLFLKLAAQLDDASHIEPLPDLDFNIKSGNLLVGITDEDDIARRFQARGVLPFGLDELEDAVESIAVAYEEFMTVQDSNDDQHTLRQAKGLLKTRINAVTDQADRGLHKMRGEAVSVEAWTQTHSPFHWFIEFPTIWRNGGFDVIIGNPPYIGLKSKQRDQFDYTWQGYETENCPDLYAVCTERASTLLNDQGRFAMIVMHSICFHKGFKPLRDHLRGSLSTLWVSSFSRIPDGLFSGSARVRNTIIIGSSRGLSKLSTSHCRRWLSTNRPWLFPTQEYTQPSNSLLRCGEIQQWPFVHDPLITKAFTHMSLTQQPIADTVTNGGNIALGYKPTAQYMLGVFVDEPPTVDPITALSVTGKPSGWLHFEDYQHRDLALMSLAGRWGYLWWLMFGDEFNVTRNVLTALPCDIERLTTAKELSPAPCDMELESLVNRILNLANELKNEMPKHLAWKINAGIKVGRYNMLKCRHITDESDWLLAQAWGLTREQYEAAGNLRDRMTFGNRE